MTKKRTKISCAVLCLALIALITAGGWWWRSIRIQRAFDLTALGLSLTHPSKSLDSEDVRSVVPRAITTRECAVIYTFLRASEIDERSDANYWLAGYLLTRDCSAAKHYYKSYLEALETGPTTQHMRERTHLILDTIDKEGCEAASHWILPSGEEVDRQVGKKTDWRH